jgi:hypothetical protein
MIVIFRNGLLLKLIIEFLSLLDTINISDNINVKQNIEILSPTGRRL